MTKPSQRYFKLINIKKLILIIFLLLLPTQFGKHFFFDFSYINGLKIDYLSIILYTTDLLALAMFILFRTLLIEFIKNNQKRVLIIVLCLLLNIAVTKYPMTTLYQSLKLIEFVLLFSLFKSINIKVHWWYLIFFISSLFELTLSTLQLLNRSSLQGLFYFFGERYLTLSSIGIAKFFINGVEHLRPYGTFSHPNSMAGFYLLVYFFLLSLPVSNKMGFKVKFIRSITLAICSLLIIISFSKIILLMYIVLNLAFFISTRKVDCKLCFFSRFITILTLSVIVFSASVNIESLNNRVLLINHGLTIMKNHFLFGIGLGNYLYFETKQPSFSSFFSPQPIHNVFLLLLIELGVMIAGFFLYLSLPFIVKIIKDKRYLLCLLSVLATGMFDHYWRTLQQNFILLAIVFGSILGANKKLKSF